MSQQPELDLHDEWSYRYHERLGIMCGSGEPTDEQCRIARVEADAAVMELEFLDRGLIEIIL